MKRVLVISLLLLAGVSLLGIYASAGNVVTVQANIIGNASYIMIEAYPNLVDFGSIRTGNQSKEIKVCVNNTGTENVDIRPVLPEDYSGDFLKYVYIRKFNSGTTSHQKIGQYSTPLSANSSVCLWFKLDLRNYTDFVPWDVNEVAEVTVRAVPQ